MKPNRLGPAAALRKLATIRAGRRLLGHDGWYHPDAMRICHTSFITSAFQAGRTVVVLLSPFIGTAYAWGAGPILTPQQAQAAIQEGRKYKTADKFFDKGLKGRPVELTGNTNIMFFNDWQDVALQSATAHQQMRDLKADEIHESGQLHAYVQIRAAETWTFRQGNTKFLRSHLVVKIGDRVVQPVAEARIIKNDSVNQVMVGKQWVITLAFDFDVLPEDLQNPITAIIIDGDGNKHQKTADLKGVLTID